MMEVRYGAPVTNEFTIYFVASGSPVDVAYIVELDGVEIGRELDLKHAHKMARAAAKAKGFTNAGITEAFGRNRQFIQGPRGGWVKYKGNQ